MLVLTLLLLRRHGGSERFSQDFRRAVEPDRSFLSFPPCRQTRKRLQCQIEALLLTHILEKQQSFLIITLCCNIVSLFLGHPPQAAKKAGHAGFHFKLPKECQTLRKIGLRRRKILLRHSQVAQRPESVGNSMPIPYLLIEHQTLFMKGPCPAIVALLPRYDS